MILITGATGKTGGEVARRMAEAGVPFRALGRNPDRTKALHTLTNDVVAGDFADPAFLDRALNGIERALLIMPNDQHQLELECAFIDAAVRAGVRHLVKLSSLESIPESTTPVTRMHVASEAHLRASGLDWTMVRPTFFMQLFLGLAPRIRNEGRIVLPTGQGTVATTDLRDVGEVIAKILTEPGHENRSYDLTGPELLTMNEVAGTFSRVLGRDIRYVDQPLEEFRERLRAMQLAEWRVEAVCREFGAIAGGAIDHTTDTMEKLLERPATSLERFIVDHRASFEADGEQ